MTTKSAQFTPGPWVVTEHSAGMICVAGPDREDLCAIGYNRTEGRNDVANATLIAAAPAMYEALRALVDVFPSVVRTTPYGVSMDISKVHDNAKAALAQAEGW